jgi:hypothetical protein
VATSQKGEALPAFNLADPGNPVRVATAGMDHRATDLAYYNDYLYPGTIETGVYVADVHDPEAPVILPEQVIDGGADCLLVGQDRLYVGDFEGHLRIFDVTTPLTPRLLGTTVLDVADPAAITPVGTITNSAHQVYDIALSSKTLFGAHYDFGLLVMPLRCE